MDIATIISEADVRVPNTFPSSQKVTWLNEVNNEFFDIVKIPKAATFNTIANTTTYTLTNEVRGRSIDKVMVGKNLFPSLLFEEMLPGRNYHNYDDTTFVLTLSPAPTSVLPGVVKFSRVASTTFVSTTLTAVPDAPAEYHWIYILALCEKMANAIDDIPKAANYGQQYRAQLAVAQANFMRGGGG